MRIACVTVPQWGLTMESAVVREWLKSVGDLVHVGEPIVLIEADKATDEVTAPATGRLMRITARADEEVKPGQVLAEIDEDDIAAIPSDE